MLNNDDRDRAADFHIEIATSGAAFHAPNGDLSRELARILRDAADGVEQEHWLRTADNDMLRRPLRDINGNTVGSVKLMRSPEPDESWRQSVPGSTRPGMKPGFW